MNQRTAIITWTIVCQDYPFGDDCSPKHYG